MVHIPEEVKLFVYEGVTLAAGEFGEAEQEAKLIYQREKLKRMS